MRLGLRLLAIAGLSACVSATGGADRSGPIAVGVAARSELGRMPQNGVGDALPVPGRVGRNCDVGRRDRGLQVARFPQDGRARWIIYDTAPGSLAPRTHYIGGFADGCMLQVTAALMTFGGADVHEALRYDPSNPAAYSVTDTAYEAIKGRVCGVRPRAPCPSDRIDRLIERTAFVTIYPRFGGTAGRVELLLDEGEMVAQARLGG